MTAALQLGENRPLKFARRLGDDRLLIDSLASLCGNYYFAGEPEQGFPLGEESVERARRLGDDVLLGGSLHGLLCCPPTSSTRLAPNSCSPRPSPAPNDPATSSSPTCCTTTPASMPCARGTSPPPGLTWNRRRKPCRRSERKAPFVSINLGWVLRQEGDPDGARSMFEAGLRISRRNGDRSGIGLRQPWPGVPRRRRRATGTGPGQLHGVAQAFLDRTGEAGKSPKRATAGTASTRCAPASAMSSASGPTPRAWRSASTRPSTWPSEQPTQPELSCHYAGFVPQLRQSPRQPPGVVMPAHHIRS